MRQLFRIIDIRRDVRETLQNFFSVYLTKDMDVYDIGCGSKPFSEFLSDKVSSHVGVDIDDGFYDSSHIDIIGSAYSVPSNDKVADAIISSQVLEHLDRPLDALKEMNRLLKPNGILFLSFPFLYPIHASPHDHLRYTEFYIEHVLKDNGFEVIDRDVIGGFWYCVGMYMGIYLQNFDRGFIKKVFIVKLLSYICRWICNLLHNLESILLKTFKKDPVKFRREWAVNYTYVVQKKNEPVIQVFPLKSKPRRY